MRNREEPIIRTFVAYLAETEHPGLEVERWPDRDRSTDPSEAIDAIAGPYAIEHTTVHALDDSRKRSAWFVEAVADLENELRGALPCRLSIRIPYRAIDKGQDWNAIKRAFCSWIMNDAAQLPAGFRSLTIPGVPFAFDIEKSDKYPGIIFSRVVKETDDVLIGTIGEKVTEKARKLAPYQSRGLTTLLLLETDDLAMMNHIRTAEALETKFEGGSVPGIDRIWYADTTLGLTEAHFYDLTALVAGYPTK
jgi:hypothetical protein